MSGQHNNTTTYSAADLLRYLDGRMDRGELLALERAMLDDEMLADSIEGYRMMQETLSDEAILARANKVATPLSEEKKIAPVLAINRFRWVGYAAAASLVLAAGWLVFNITRPENTLPAQSDNLTNPSYVNADKTDSGLIDKEAKLADNESVALSEQPKKEIRAEGTGEITKPAQANEVAKLTDKKSSPQPSIVLPEDDLAGKTAGKEIADADPRMRTQRAAPSVINSQRASVNFTITDSLSAIPIPGWDVYKLYLTKTLDLPHFDNPGVIEISLSEAGKIMGVTVEAPIGEKEKSSIIQTIKLGPEWKNKTGKPAKATIQFQ